MATKIHYFGDVAIATKYKASGEILLETLRKTNFVPSSLNRDFPDGTKVIARRVTPDLETIDIWAGAVTTKDRYVWTLLYAPCPPPDPQDWGGWIEADRDTLEATNFLGMFSLLGYGMPFYGDFTTDDSLSYTPQSISSQVTQGGWFVSGVSGYWTGSYLGSSYYMGLTQRAIGLERLNISRNTRTVDYTFPANLFNTVTITDWYESGVKHWCGGGYPNEETGFVIIPLNPNPLGGSTPPLAVGTGVVGPYDPGYTRGHIEGLISWESLYMIGFWKWEWITYTPSSYLDEDNYCGFYEYYSSDYSASTVYLADQGETIWFTMAYNFSVSYYGFTDEMEQQYLQIAGDPPCHLTFDYVQTGANAVTIPDPDSDGNSNSVGSIIYETHFAGKYEGAEFDETIESATWSGNASWVGSWSGDCCFAWMSRMYDKAVLLEGDEGQEAPSDHNLMLASWLVGPAAGIASDTNKIPGCTGINRTVYRMKHGTDEVTIEYSASHPGWHDVYTDEDGRTWRAYGDLFAALKKVRG